MAKILTMVDSLKNFVSSLNTARDKQYSSAYYAPDYSDEQLYAAFRASWMARKTVTIPALDATRKWREWGADEQQIESIEALEKNLGLQGKVKDAIQLARLFGGAALYFSIRGDDPSQPLQLSSIKKGSLEFVTVLSRRVLTPGEMETDPLSQYYNKPKNYQVASTSGTQYVHPSRLAIFIGADLPDPDLAVSAQQGWGDSSLVAPYEAIKAADGIGANISSLVYEAKVDILHIPGLADIMADSTMRGLLVDRIELCGQLKGNNGMLILDAEETYESKSFTFSGLTDIQQQALQIVSGAADIPVTRFLGQTPSGLSSTGESDLRNYYDAVASMQSLTITPAMKGLDDALIISALGQRPADVFYTWSSLWQVSDEVRSKISKETAETIKIITETRLFPDDVLSKAFANLLIERGVVPDIEMGELPETPKDPADDPDGDPSVGAKDSSTPKTLYVSRKVINAKEIITWARSQGIKQTMPAAEMHVTIAFSREPLDWTEVGEDWTGDERGRLLIRPGGPRLIETFGEGAKVLLFTSQDLEWRYQRIRDAGASWDHDGYQPHITITYGDIPDGIEAYQGPILLGPEVFAEISEDWNDMIEEQNT